MAVWLPPLLAAPFAGSVAGVLIRRLPAGRNVGLARSACESCNHPLGPPDLVPILSFVWLRGKCRFCRAPISWFHPAVELAAVLIAAIVAAVDVSVARLWIDCGLGWSLMTLAWIDARHYILPDVLTLPLLVAGLCATWWLTPEFLTAHALGAIAGYLVFRAIAIAYRRLRGGDGLGEGDAKLLAAAGAWLGIFALPRVVFIAAALGIVMTLTLYGRQRATAPVPFGPALALALFILRLYVQG